MIYTTTTPNKKIVTYHPFDCAQYKTLLVVAEHNEPLMTKMNVKDVVNRYCTCDDVLDDIDVLWVFITLCSKSIGEVMHLRYKCSSCEKSFPIDIDVNDVVYDPGRSTHKIPLDEMIGLSLKPITFPQLNDISATIVEAIDYIYDRNTKYYAKDVSVDELKSFVENNVNSNALRKINNYIVNQPRLKLHHSCRCKFCGAEHKIEIDQFDQFFHLLMSGDNFENHIKTNFTLMQQHNYSLSDLESMLPYEREIYLVLLNEHVKEINKKQHDITNT